MKTISTGNCYIFLSILSFFMMCAHAVPAKHNNAWTRSEIMDPFGLYILEWKVENKEIVFTTTVNTRGYIGLGFSYKHGNMMGADLVIAWVDDQTGLPNILDTHGNRDGNRKPTQDDTQNYVIINGYQNATHTVVQFKRPLETCDPDDINIASDTIKVLWSYGDKDPNADVSNGHGKKNRGFKNLRLLNPQEKKPVSTANKYWDFTVKNISIESKTDTIYWCKIFRVPDLKERHHIIGYEPLLTKELSSRSPLIHHMTLYECSSYFGSDPNAWDVWSKTNGNICNSKTTTPHDWESCYTAIATWNMGSAGQFFPEHIGIPVGGKNSVKYYMLEIHYDNPHSKQVVDHSGFRLHYTPFVRQYDAGILVSGITVSETQMIPPYQKMYHNQGICGPSCTSARQIPEAGINVVSVTLHSHVAGRKMMLRHVRGGKELDRIVEDNHFEPNICQETFQLENETTILPDDYIITDCAYETNKRKRPTLGGYSTKQEVCLSFILYYPRIDLAACYSMTPVKEFFETFGVYGFYGLNMTDVENLILYNGELDAYTANILVPGLGAPIGDLNDKDSRIRIEAHRNAKEFGDLTDEDLLYQNSTLNKLIISDPAEFHDRTFLTHLNQLPWHESLFTKRVEQAMINGKHLMFCRLSKDSRNLSPEIFGYPNFTQLVKPASTCPYHQYFEIHSAVCRVKALGFWFCVCFLVCVSQIFN